MAWRIFSNTCFSRGVSRWAGKSRRASSLSYCTTLEPLLASLQVDRLLITGVAADICVLFTAHDAHVRGFELHVPQDCVAANSAQRTEWTLRHLREALRVDTSPWQQLKFLQAKK